MTEDEANLTIHNSWHLEFEHAAGTAATRFIGALGEGKMLASPCPKCKRILCPPREFCERCFVQTADDWVEVGPVGSVEGFTVVTAAFPGYREPPYALAYVRPDGASTAIGNYVEGLDLKSPEDAYGAVPLGRRARAVYSDDPQKSILDFHWEIDGKD